MSESRKNLGRDKLPTGPVLEQGDKLEAYPTRPMVFVLDDEAAVRDSLQCLLESARYAVRTFATPDQFLGSSELPRPACLILDLTMPGMSGLEVLRIVECLRPRLPTVVLTGYADVANAVTAMRLGAVHLLEKPCGDNELLKAVSEAFAQAVTLVDRQQYADTMQFRLKRLSARERQLLDHFVQGENIKTIAGRLGTSANTVRNQRCGILKKMEAESVADLVRMVLAERGHVTPN